MNGLIFNIQRYSLHDGGGIRTIVFLKGCPLHCPWCSNPESQSFKIEEGIIKDRCINCSKCSHDAEECPSDAITTFGRYMDVDEVIKEVEKDMVFYHTSEGGVTLSGGEVLSQPKFAIELLRKLKQLGINTAIETSGQGDTRLFMDMAKYVDLILFDFKIMNKAKAYNVLRADMSLIKKNLKALIENNNKVIARIPLIPEYNMDEANIDEIINCLLALGLKEVHVLPFHQYGSKKYEYINKEYNLRDIKPPTEEQVNNIKEKIELRGLKVNVGGL